MTVGGIIVDYGGELSRVTDGRCAIRDLSVVIRRTTAGPIGLGIGLLVGACSAGSSDSAHPLVPSAEIPKVTSGPVGSLANPRVLACAAGSVTDEPAGTENIVAGPLIYPNAKMLSRPGSDRDFYPGGVGELPDGSKSYKMGTFVNRGATVTVSVVPQAGTTVRLQGPSTLGPDEAVTYQACATGGATAWVGGFNLSGAGRSAACLPLQVRVKGESQPRRIVISLFEGVCKDPSAST